MNNEDIGIVEQALSILRRRKWVVVQATIAVPLIALVFSLAQQKEYTATATLLFHQPPTGQTENSSIVDPTREAATNGELVGLPVVAEQAASSLKGVSASVIAGSIEVAPSPEAETASVSATTPSAELSAQIANAYARAYITFRMAADRNQLQNAIDLAETSLKKLGPEGGSGAEGAALKKQLNQLRLTQALQTGGAELVQPASPPSSPSSPKTSRNVGLGLVLGLLLGFALAAILERIDRRIRSTKEIELIYNLPLLARIPRSRRLAGKRQQGLGTQTPEGEAFRVLRTNLRFFSVNRDLRSILVVSPEEGDGKSTVTRGLATTMAEMGDEVVLVEADLRKGGELRQVGGLSAPGLSDVLAGTSLDRVLLKVEVSASAGSGSRALAVLPSGPPPPNPSELLESPRMSDVIGELQERFQYVIFDSPAIGAVSDALSLVPKVSGVIIVAGLGKTTRNAARELRAQFSLLDNRPIGVIVNFAELDYGKYSQYYRSDISEQQSAPS